MDVFDKEKILDSLSIIADTRERETERAQKRYQMLGIPVERGKIDYGDYTYNITLSNGKKLIDIKKPIFPKFTIERKESLDELAGCFTHDRDRFMREFERANTAGARVLLMIENASYENLVNHKYRSKLNPKAFLASLIAWQIRYGFYVVMCKEETTPKLIYEWCKRDLKSRLEAGDYDSI